MIDICIKIFNHRQFNQFTYLSNLHFPTSTYVFFSYDINLQKGEIMLIHVFVKLPIVSLLI